MLAIHPSKDPRGTCVAHILPCQVSHNGPVNTSQRYWSPTVSPDGNALSYFRGRKLNGTSLEVPLGYRGMVMSSTNQTIQEAQSPSDVVNVLGQEDAIGAVGIMEERVVFQEIIVWGHEAARDDSTDAYLKGINEWIPFAEQIHSYASTGHEDGNRASKA